MERLSRDEMIRLVERLKLGEGDEAEATEWVAKLEQSTSCPHISDLIFYPDEDLTAEQTVDKALTYRPIEL